MNVVEILPSLRSLVLNMTLIVTLSYLVSQTRMIHYFKKTKLNSKELLLLTFLFGSLSVIGWYFGVQHGTLTANMRYIPGIVGGLYGGPVVGVGALLISGIFRLMDMGGERGLITGIVMGLTAGFVGSYLKQKAINVTTMIALYTVVAAMVIHFTIFSVAESLSETLDIFLNVGWVLYLLNISGVVIFVNIMQQEFRRNDHQKALENLAIMEERERIAKDLHDGFAQTMFFLNTKTVTLKKLIGTGKQAKALIELEQVRDVIKEGFTDIRQTIFNLRTAINAESDIVNTLKEYLQKFQFQTGIATEMIIYGEEKIPKLALEVEIHLFRIVQEALNNAIKHAESTKIILTIESIDEIINLSITDNGKGIDLNQDKPCVRKKFGILNMQERAWSIGAKFKLDSQLGEGTKVSVSLPLKKSS